MPSKKRGEAQAPKNGGSLPGIEVRQLRAFVALARCEGVSAAAEELGLAQSTVSEALAALERALGAPLILRRRGGHAFALTAAGQALLPHARKAVAAVDDVRLAMASVSRQARATLNIIANESVSSYLLPGVLPGLRQRWPHTRFTVSVAGCAGVRQGVASGDFDLGLLLQEARSGEAYGRRTGRAAAPLAERRTLASAVPLVLFAGRSHPLARARRPAPVGREALAAYPLFVSDAAGDFHELVLRLFSRERGASQPIEAIGSVEGVKKAVAGDTRAIGLLPAYAVADELRRTALTPVPVRPPLPFMRLEALVSRSRTPHPSAEELLSAVRDSLDAQ